MSPAPLTGAGGSVPTRVGVNRETPLAASNGDQCPHACGGEPNDHDRIDGDVGSVPTRVGVNRSSDVPLTHA